MKKQLEENGTFKFVDFLCEKDRKLWNKFYASLAGKTVYIPKSSIESRRYFERRNNKIKNLFHELKAKNKTNTACFIEITLQIPEAKNLSHSRIRDIVYGKELKKAA